MGNELDRRLELATAASIEAGTFALSELRARSGLEVRQKNPREFVSDLDAATEEHIRHHLAQQYPNDDVQGEELGGAQTDAYWCIDPIDGTANFLRGSPLWGVSIAYVENEKTTVGVIALPALGLTVGAAEGSPLFLNTNPYMGPADTGIRVIALGENPYWSDIDKLERAFRQQKWGIAEYRCATVGLAFAALGYTDGYVEHHTNMWDIAAGVLLCQRAGLEVSYGTIGAAGIPTEWVQAGTADALSLVSEALAQPC